MIEGSPVFRASNIPLYEEEWRSFEEKYMKRPPLTEAVTPLPFIIKIRLSPIEEREFFRKLQHGKT